MKFLCVGCDEPMKLQSVDATGGGALSVLYECPGCAQQIAMLTNPLETEMVQSLGVRIGPAEAGGGMAHGARAAHAPPGGEAPATESGAAASRCPFSGVVREMEEAAQVAPAGPIWSAAALARLENIPDFVRPMARQGIEHYARSNGYAEIDEQVLEEARTRFGM